MDPGTMMTSYCLMLICLLTSGVLTLEDRYYSNDEMTSYLHNVAKKYPAITEVYSIGNSVLGRPLWVMALAAVSPEKHLPLRPEVKYVANIHGNEVVGRGLMLNFIEYLTTNFATNPDVRRLLTSSRMHILPSMNPDGFKISKPGACKGVVGRYNHNNTDLNRDFPEHFRPIPRVTHRQSETQSVMNWMEDIKFVLSASFHGGTFVTNYPFDNYNCDACPKYKASRYAEAPDDALFRHLALSYSRPHAVMYRGDTCEDTGPFPDGITNGAEWYPVAGGMQDFNYIQHGCLELTMEVSCCKYPLKAPSFFWAQNKQSMINFWQNIAFGVKGYVRFANGTAAPGAYIDEVNKKSYIRAGDEGEYWRLLKPGTTSLRASIRGEVMSGVIDVDINPSQAVMKRLDFILDREYAVSSSDKLRTVHYLLWCSIFLWKIL